LCRTEFRKTGLIRVTTSPSREIAIGGSVGEQYYRQQIKVVDERLAFAGLRLAAVLNEVLGRFLWQNSPPIV